MMAIGVFMRRAGLFFGVLGAWILPSVATADTLTLKNGTQVGGHIESVGDGQAIVTATTPNGGTVRLPYQLSEIQSVEMPAPPELAQVSGQTPEQVVSTLSPLVKEDAGLPADWVIDAMGQLADAYLSLHQDEKANAIYAQIAQLYPDSSYTAIATAGQAKVLLAQGKVPEALDAVQPLIDAANQTLVPSASEARAYANAFLVYGQILESQKKYSEALEAYLTVKTLFYENQALVDQSAMRVQNLRAQQPGVSVE
jgi:tetratricopeptide (TPR) repeat protein